ncbi:MAG: DUF1700 domain-containing protein [Clostridia bacterium]|nr:DUF1700 domain-containing protein [Clostridia bacterium]
MNKQKFISELRMKLSGLPSKEVEDRLSFYLEMIDDRIEDGITEEAAIAELGSVEEIAAQITAEIPLSKIVKEKIKPQKRLRAWEIVLLAVGSPLWLSLAVAALAVILSLYVVLWSVIVSLWAVFAAVAICTPGGLAAGILFACQGNFPVCASMISAALVCGGLAIFLFFGCMAATKGTAKLTGKIALSIKKCFMRKEKKA